MIVVIKWRKGAVTEAFTIYCTTVSNCLSLKKLLLLSVATRGVDSAQWDFWWLYLDLFSTVMTLKMHIEKQKKNYTKVRLCSFFHRSLDQAFAFFLLIVFPFLS